MSASVLLREENLSSSSKNTQSFYRLKPEETKPEDDFYALHTIPNADFVEITIPTGSGKTKSALLHVLGFSLQEHPAYLLRVCGKKDKKTLNAVVVDSLETVQRVVNAWRFEAADLLIATASVSGDFLSVIDCTLNTWNIPFNVLPELADITLEERSQFEIDEDGSYLYWPSGDVHLDLESLRVCIDEELKDKLNAESIIYDENFGKAIAAVRRKFKIKQSDIDGVSERHVRRIEKGDRPRISTLEKLAKAHNLSLDNYLDEIAKEVRQLN